MKRTVAVCKVAALDHELTCQRVRFITYTDDAKRTYVGNYTVESAAGEAEAVLARRELPEVTRGHGNSVIVQLEDDTPDGFRPYRKVELYVVLF